MRIGASEAAKLVNGVSICKRVEGVEQWLSLNPHTLQGDQVKLIRFDVEAALQGLPIIDRENKTMYQTMVNSIKNGNGKEVRLDVNGELVKCRLQANPQKKVVNAVDEHGLPLQIESMAKAQQTAKSIHQRLRSNLSSKRSEPA